MEADSAAKLPKIQTRFTMQVNSVAKLQLEHFDRTALEAENPSITANPDEYRKVEVTDTQTGSSGTEDTERLIRFPSLKTSQGKISDERKTAAGSKATEKLDFTSSNLSKKLDSNTCRVKNSKLNTFIDKMFKDKLSTGEEKLKDDGNSKWTKINPPKATSFQESFDPTCANAIVGSALESSNKKLEHKKAITSNYGKVHLSETGNETMLQSENEPVLKNDSKKLKDDRGDTDFKNDSIASRLRESRARTGWLQRTSVTDQTTVSRNDSSMSSQNQIDPIHLESSSQGGKLLKYPEGFSGKDPVKICQTDSKQKKTDHAPQPASLEPGIGMNAVKKRAKELCNILLDSKSFPVSFASHSCGNIIENILIESCFKCLEKLKSANNIDFESINLQDLDGSLLKIEFGIKSTLKSGNDGSKAKDDSKNHSSRASESSDDIRVVFVLSDDDDEDSNDQKCDKILIEKPSSSASVYTNHRVINYQLTFHFDIFTNEMGATVNSMPVVWKYSPKSDSWRAKCQISEQTVVNTNEKCMNPSDALTNLLIFYTENFQSLNNC